VQYQYRFFETQCMMPWQQWSHNITTIIIPVWRLLLCSDGVLPDSFVVRGTDNALHLRQPQTAAKVACVTRQYIRLYRQTVINDCYIRFSFLSDRTYIKTKKLKPLFLSLNQQRLSKQEGLAVASIARDVGSSSRNHSSDIMHFLPRLLKKTLQQKCHIFPVQTLSK